ncbi:MAG: hypothetical protein ACRES7_07770 [Gammaproteobacteria bacterium]
MLPSDIDALHSGKLVIEQPAQKVEVLTAGEMVQMTHVGLATSFAMGIFAGMNEMAAAESTWAQERKEALKALQPYVKTMNNLALSEDFYTLGKSVGAAVPWLRSSGSQVILANGSHGLDHNQMRQATKRSGLNAVAFVMPKIVFLPSLKALYVIGDIQVYVQGQKRVLFLSGGALIAGSKLAATAPTPGTSATKAIAGSDTSDAIEARANLWFANDGARFKQGLDHATAVFSVKLKDYLTGIRATSNPYKY